MVPIGVIIGHQACHPEQLAKDLPVQCARQRGDVSLVALHDKSVLSTTVEIDSGFPQAPSTSGDAASPQLEHGGEVLVCQTETLGG